MNLLSKYLLLDLATMVWLILVFLIVFFWLPSWICYSSNSCFVITRLISCFVRITVALLVGVIALSSIHLFNGLTLFLWYLSCLAIGRSLHKQSILKINRKNFFINISQSYLLNSCQRLSLIVVDCLDGGLSLRALIINIFQKLKLQLISSLALLPTHTTHKLFNTIAFLVILNLAIILRCEYPLKQLRFANPNSYLDLLKAQEIITAHFSFTKDIPIFSTLGAIVSLISSIDAMQTIRFLSPLIGLLLLLSLYYCLFVFTQKSNIALVGFFCLGCYVFTVDNNYLKQLPKSQQFLSTLISNLNTTWIRQWTASELELGILFLLIALACLANIVIRQNTQQNLINLIACLFLISLTAPSLLILLAIGSLGAFLIRQSLLIVVTIAWISLAAIAIYLYRDQTTLINHHYFTVDSSFVFSLPIAASLLVSLVFLAITNLVDFINKKSVELLFLIIFIVISCNFFLPLDPQINYLEYEIAARKSLEIRTLFPRKQWLIVAPLEQLAQSYSLGWYEDLAQFVNKYNQKVEQPNFMFPFAVPDIFIFVEKRPFNYLTVEAQLPYSILSDPTYRNYRSSTGRTALEFAAWQLCEKYRLNHKDTSIYYEDNNLKIYHFTN